MRNKNKLYSIALASIFLVLFLILVSSAVSAASIQNSLARVPYPPYASNANNAISIIRENPYVTAAPISDNLEIRSPVYSGSDIDDIIDTYGDGTILSIDATKFAAFYYDNDNNVSTESFSILDVADTQGNVIGKGGIVYKTTIQKVPYEYENLTAGWDTYPVIGFFGEQYIPLNSYSANKFAKLILDSNDKYTVRTGEILDLGQGYAVEVKQIEVNSSKVWLEFTKDGEFVDDEIISVDNTSNTWEVKLDGIQGENDVVVFKVHVNQIFQGAVDSIAQIEGIWLIDYANAITINTGDEFGALNSVSVIGDTLRITNGEIFTLTRNSDQEIGQGLYFKVANTSSYELRFYIFKQITDPGTYEIRGEVAFGEGNFTWDATNFAGLYYDPDDNINTESLRISVTKGNMIPERGLVYYTIVQNINFEYSNPSIGWNKYPVIGFFGVQYIPLNSDSANKFAKLVLDSDDRYTVGTGETLDLGQGYAIKVKQIDVTGSKVWLEFTKDGKYVDDENISVINDLANSWEVDLDGVQGENNVSVLKVHVNQVFQGEAGNVSQIEGVWLIDYANATAIDTNDEFGALNDVSITGDILTISNEEVLTLTRDSEVEIGQGMYFKVADTPVNELRYYPFIKKVIGEKTGLEYPVYAYITNPGSDTVSVMNTATNTVTATMPVGIEPFGVAVSTDGTKAYVTNNASNTVSIIDIEKDNVVSVNVGNEPAGAAINLEGTKVYVTNSEDDTVSVIDTSTNTVIATVPVGLYPSGIAVTPDGKKVYVASSAYMENSTYSSTVSVIDAMTNTVTGKVEVGAGSMGVAVSPNGRKAYVVNSYDNTVSVIDISTNNVISTVPVGSWPIEVTVSPDGAKAYVTNGNDNTVSVIDISTNTVIGTISVGTYPVGVSVTPDGREVYIVNCVDSTISIINTTTSTVTATIPVGAYPFSFGQFMCPFPIRVIPVINFSASATNGYAPLSVQFADLSQYAISWDWDFGDGTTSTDQNPTHTYSTTGTYTVNLAVSNSNGIAFKNATITVNEEDSGSSGGSSHSSGGGGGGGGGSPEPAKNVEVKELSQAFITNGKAIKFDFAKNATCIVYVSFDAKKTAGKTTTIAEQLKNKSTLVSGLPEGEVYKYFNVWVGNSGFASSGNIGNPAICFKVEKSWLQDKNIDKNSIILNRYSNKTWEQLPVSMSGEDSKYLYYTANVSGFSFFAITGNVIAGEEINKIQPENQTQDLEGKTGNASADIGQDPDQGKITSLPGFVTIYGVASLLALYLYKRK